MLSRRTLSGKAAVGAAAAVALGAARTGVAAVRGSHASHAPNQPGNDPGALDGVAPSAPPPAPPAAAVEDIASPPPWELVRPLAAGAAVSHGWRLAELGPVQHGSCVVTLANARGRSHRIHLCRNDGAPHGLIYTRRLDLVVMNDGHGELPTEEGLGQAVARLAHVIAANEGTAADAFFAELLPHAERVRRFAEAEAQLR